MIKYYVFLFVCLCHQAISATKVDTVAIFSAKMKRTIPAVVITPSYADTSKRFPVLYLLHGLSDDHTKWVKTVPAIKDLAEQYQLIIVCPDGGYGSWYLDSPIDPTYQYETFLSNELIKYIDSHYRTIANKGGRIITGLSMGGHGALYIASKHPQKFAAAGSMSGAVDLYSIGLDEDLQDSNLPERLGNFTTHQHIWKTHSVFYSTHHLKAANMPFIIDCGKEDFLIDDNRALHRKMLLEKIPHEYIERPGTHNWEYWSISIVKQVAYLNKYLKR